MILSYHPCYIGDENRLCAGRNPDSTDAAAMQNADAVILPQGCHRPLFEMAAASGAPVFPDYTHRFAFSGKIGQTALFRRYGALHPDTMVFESTDRFRAYSDRFNPKAPFGYPFVFKFTWSGEGRNVWRVNTPGEFEALLKKADTFERTGQKGFLLQRYIETAGRSLRVVVTGETYRSYWRVQPDPIQFSAQSAQGAVIDPHSDKDLQEYARAAVRDFCHKTRINLAGFDIVYESGAQKKAPLFLEINYYFGRRGLGGSEAFYELLCAEIDNWLFRRHLKTARPKPDGSVNRAISNRPVHRKKTPWD